MPDRTETSIERVLRMRERQRHQIPLHLFANYTPLPTHRLVVQGTYIDNILPLVKAYALKDKADPLVLGLGEVRRGSVLFHVENIEQCLRTANEHHETNHTIDWWYQPPGQARANALIAIRPCGLYELTYD